MEPVGLTLGIVASIKTCCEGYALVHSFATAPTILARTRCKFEIERTRFLVWGRSWGFVDEHGDVSPADAVQKRLATESDVVAELLLSILNQIAKLLSDGEKLKERYSTKQRTQPQSNER